MTTLDVMEAARSTPLISEAIEKDNRRSKAALVTGSTSGIGLAAARAFASKGANVTINGLGRSDLIEKDRAEIEREFGVEVAYSPADMTNPDEIVGMVRA